MAVAAATAVIAPATFLAAPAAFATTGPSSPTITGTPSPSESTPAEVTPSPTASPSTPAGAATTPGTSGTPSPSSSATSTTEPQAPGVCESILEFPPYDDHLVTELGGLPKKITAGSGFHPFTVTLTNSGTVDRALVGLRIVAGQTNPDTAEDYSTYLTVQYKDPASGK